MELHGAVLVFTTFLYITFGCQLIPNDPNHLITTISGKQYDHIKMVCTFTTTDNTRKAIAWMFAPTLRKEHGTALTYGEEVLQPDLNLNIETRYMVHFVLKVSLAE